MSSGSYCTSCGSKREGAKPFCTNCGARQSTQTPAPVATPIAASQPRKLRCVECGSEIPHGLVCPRCASHAPHAAPTTFAQLPFPSPPSPQPPVSVTAAPKAQEALWQRVLVGGVVLTLMLLLGFLKADGKHGWAASREILSHRNGLDGTYVWQSAADSSTWSRIRIDGKHAYVSDSTGWQDSGRVDRTGDTIRFSNDLSSSRAAASDASKVDLGKLVQDGQAIEMDADGRSMRFVRQ